MIEYVEMFSFIKCEVYDVIRGYHVTMWPIELLYVVCTYDELNYYMKNDEDDDVDQLIIKWKYLLYMCICEVLTHKTLALCDIQITCYIVNLSDQKLWYIDTIWSSQ